MSRSMLSISVLAATVFMTPAFAVDGTTLINQATVLGTGGFPYHITQSGSYRLSGNLVAASSAAIVVSASNVTLDFNGFTISCTACSGVPGILSTAAGTTLENGTVTGFGNSGSNGVFFQAAGAKVDHLNVNGNTTGIVTTGADLTVTNSNVSNNTVTGISGSSSQVTVVNCIVSGNGQDGIDVQSGLITGNTISTNGLGGSFTRGGVIVFGSGGVNITNNLISGNAVFGIALGNLGSPTVGYGSNTFAGNNTDVSNSANLISMHNNVCSAGGC